MLAMLLMLLSAEPMPDRDSIKTNDLADCAVSRFERADAELKAEWAKLEHEKTLRHPQKAWLAWRVLSVQRVRRAAERTLSTSTVA